MSDKDINKSVEIEESALDEASGGLPAVQKVREAAARMTSTASTSLTSTSHHSGGANVVLGDGSVKTI